MIMTWKSAIILRSEVMADALAKENCAKKVRVTPRIKNGISSSSNLTKRFVRLRCKVNILRKRIGIIGKVA